ncbi:MAG TPA: GNAT family N-acetyltransferase [Solirubrobacteraceae bacterium]|jgi:GNAT superfamily N-acetyltransferase|nr:GNAT family N-acetyltransferase [Solirubrobacteraceae bacterium]
MRFLPSQVDAGDGERLVVAMRAEMAELYPGLVLDGEQMPKAGPAELSPPGGAFVVGYEGAVAVCCGGVKRLDRAACEIKRMYVIPDARGRGLARVLLHELEEIARRLGYVIARLDTGPRQLGARRIYESEGYAPIGNFNANPVATFFGEKPL